jgi:oxygen-independent coproporphyrinogen-3 oxidase
VSWTTWWAPSNRTFDLDLAELDRFGYQDRAHLFEPILDAAEETGLLRRLGRRVQLTPKGFKYRDILSWMFFSDTVVQLDRDYYERLHEQNRRARKHMGAPVGISGIRTAHAAS